MNERDLWAIRARSITHEGELLHRKKKFRENLIVFSTAEVLDGRNQTLVSVRAVPKEQIIAGVNLKRFGCVLPYPAIFAASWLSVAAV